MCDTVAAQLVGHEPHGFLSLTLQQSAKESPRCTPVPTAYGAKKRPRLGRCWSSLLRNSWVHKFACFEVNEAQAESLCAVTEVAERPGAMLGLIGLDSRIGVVDVTS